MKKKTKPDTYGKFVLTNGLSFVKEIHWYTLEIEYTQILDDAKVYTSKNIATWVAENYNLIVKEL